MADPDAIRYLRIAQADLAEARRTFSHDLMALMGWLEESGAAPSPFEQIADLTFLIGRSF